MTAWTGPELPLAERFESAQRQLELQDRVIGLEAQLAQLSQDSILTPSEQLSVERRLTDLQTSLPWAISRRLAAPARWVRRARRQ